MSTATPLVLITGQLLTDAIWAPQIAHFGARRRILLADNRSDDTIEAMAERLLTAAPERFALCAHAMGGFVAFEVLRQSPERVVRICLLATLASADGPAQTERRQGYIRLVEGGRFEEVAKERIPMLLAPEHRADTQLTALISQMAQDTGAETFLRQQRAIMGRIDSRPRLGEIRVPTLIVRGEHDGITTVEHQHDIASGIAHAKSVTLPGAGHMLTLEAPDAVNTLLEGWLEGC